MVQQLLDMASMDRHNPPSPRELDAAALLRTELGLLVPAAAARGIELSLEAPDTLRCTMDLLAFQSVLHNLVNNAIAYGAENGRVQITLRQEHDGLRLAVADDGPGIAPARRTLVFERFHRGRDHDAPGAGLGLAIVREAAARLGGTVRLEDGIDGKGCRFLVTMKTCP